MLDEVQEVVVRDTSSFPSNWQSLEHVFRAGRVPPELPDGRFAGRFVLFHVLPGLSGLAGWLEERLRPWQGKLFDARHATGFNLIARSALPLSRCAWPFYNLYLPAGPRELAAFPFRLAFGPSLEEPRQPVLKILYDLPFNPPLTVQPVQDELILLEPGRYLGKAYFAGPTFRPLPWAFFTLESTD